MDKRFYNKIVKLIPSDTLKEFLKGSKFRFQEKDLLAIINEYSKDYNEKISLLQEVIDCIEDKSVVFHAKKLIELHSQYHDEFIRAADCFAYDITIIEDDNFLEERHFVTKTFEDALTLIKCYNRHYSDLLCMNVKQGTLIDGKYVYYKILKCTTVAPKKPSDIHKWVGNIGECLLGKKLEILDVRTYTLSITDIYKCKNKDCDEDCKSQCINMYQHYIKFPSFLEQYQLVAYDEWDKTKYGILPYVMREGEDDSYVIDLEDNDFITNREVLTSLDDFRIFDAHWHPSFFDIYLPSREDIPDYIYENYLYALEILKKLDYDSYNDSIRAYIIK